MANFDKATHPDSKYWSYATLRLDQATLLLGGESPDGELNGKCYSELPERIRMWVDALNNAIRGGGLRVENVLVTRRNAQERIKPKDLGRNEYVDWDTELPVAELKKWCEANGHQHPWSSGQQPGGSALQRTIRSDREETLLRVIAALRELAELPKEHSPAADKISALMECWGWEKPTKDTIAETVLNAAASIPRNTQK